MVNRLVTGVRHKNVTSPRSCIGGSLRQHMWGGQNGNIGMSAIRPVFVLALSKVLTPSFLYFGAAV